MGVPRPGQGGRLAWAAARPEVRRGPQEPDLGRNAGPDLEPQAAC